MDPRKIAGRLVIATHNPGKLWELRQLLEPHGVEAVSAGELGLEEPEESEQTFVGNALLKARAAAVASGFPAFADDSGLCVDALDGAPGVYSARYAGEPKSDVRNNEKLLADLAGQTDRRAHFACVLVLVRSADDPQPIIAEGEWHGTILEAQRGADGFGYDPLFYVPTHCQTAAELDGTIKNQLSHRGQAMQKLIARLPTL